MSESSWSHKGITLDMLMSPSQGHDSLFSKPYVLSALELTKNIKNILDPGLDSFLARPPMPNLSEMSVDNFLESDFDPWNYMNFLTYLANSISSISSLYPTGAEIIMPAEEFKPDMLAKIAHITRFPYYDFKKQEDKMRSYTKDRTMTSHLWESVLLGYFLSFGNIKNIDVCKIAMHDLVEDTQEIKHFKKELKKMKLSTEESVARFPKKEDLMIERFLSSVDDMEEEYESKKTEVINKYLDYLGFTDKERSDMHSYLEDITRSPFETYTDYISRASKHFIQKVSDRTHNTITDFEYDLSNPQTDMDHLLSKSLVGKLRIHYRNWAFLNQTLDYYSSEGFSWMNISRMRLAQETNDDVRRLYNQFGDESELGVLCFAIHNNTGICLRPEDIRKMQDKIEVIAKYYDRKGNFQVRTEKSQNPFDNFITWLKPIVDPDPRSLEHNGFSIISGDIQETMTMAYVSMMAMKVLTYAHMGRDASGRFVSDGRHNKIIPL